MDGEKLKRQAGWWCTASLRISCDEIPLVNCTSAAQVRDAFELGGVGMACADQAVYNRIPYHGDYELWDCENGLFLYLGCNSKSEIFSNEAVRSTLTYAIDRDKLVETYYGGFAYSASLPASPLSPYYNTTLAERYGYNSDKLTALLTESELQGAQITLLLNSDDSLRLRAGRAIADMLHVCGLEVTTLEVNATEFKKQLKEGEYDLYLGQTRLSSNMDLSAFFSKNGSLNYGGLADTTTYAICLEALANNGNYYNLHKEVMDRGLICPILFRSYAIYATRGLVTELTPARDNMFFYSIGKTMADAKMDA